MYFFRGFLGSPMCLISFLGSWVPVAVMVSMRQDLGGCSSDAIEYGTCFIGRLRAA